jgi:5'-3' exoribonuclease 1
MGIPSFFNYIIKSHKTIFKKRKSIKHVDNLYFDSNSIIYDCVRNTPMNKDENILVYEMRLYNSICEKINSYIETIQPSKIIILAFDGVAPFAKIEQQRTRRYKSTIIKNIEEQIKKTYTNIDDKRVSQGQETEQEIQQKPETTKWDQTAITPGTTFMDNLELYLKKYYNTYSKTHKNRFEKIIVSGPNEKGEGEHKLFNFIRENETYHNNTTTCIYGLDADLIMLCLNHIWTTKELYLFREKPSFHTDLDEDFDNDELCFMDIHNLSQDIFESMISSVNKTKSTNNINIIKNKLNDFIFITFMLGNDFLPHFPSINIRTNGIQILLETYTQTIKDNETICQDNKIQWKLFKKIIEVLSKNEETYIRHEYSTLIKQYKRNIMIHKQNNTNLDTYITKETQKETPEYMLQQFLHYPSSNRDIELYIDPYKQGWKNRYYESLLHFDTLTNDKIKQVCMNYLEGLEWSYMYYKYGCVDYKWKYNYMYPPLLIDILNYIPYFETNFFDLSSNPDKIKQHTHTNDIHKYTQLSYVLPYECLYLLPEKIKTHMKINYKNNYITHQFYWAFSKYFWESHVDMPYIDIFALQQEILHI